MKPAFLASRKQVPTAATVCPRLVSRATSSYVLCRPISSRVQPYASICAAPPARPHGVPGPAMPGAARQGRAAARARPRSPCCCCAYGARPPG